VLGKIADFFPKTVKKLLSFATAGILFWATALQGARADDLAWSVPETTGQYNSPPGNDGFTFTPSSDILVTALDYYLSQYAPQNGIALVDAHQVGIYAATDTSTPVVQTTIGPGSGTSIVGGPAGYSYFVSVPVTPTELFSGQQYMLAGTETQADTENAGPDAYNGIPLDDFVTAPSITLNGYYYDTNAFLDYPTITYPNGYLGPSFEFTTIFTPDARSISSPEPSSLAVWSLLGAVAIAVGWRGTKQEYLAP
jgi:hypothetical protein